MQLVSSGSASAQDISAGYVTVATVAAPASGSTLYRLVVRVTGLDAAHSLLLRETQGAAQYVFGPLANGATTEVVEEELALDEGEGDVAVALTDGVSVAAAWSWHLYKLDLLSEPIAAPEGTSPASPPDDPGQTTGYLVTRDGHGEPAVGITVDFRLVAAPATTTTGSAYPRARWTETSGAGGLLEATLVRGATYEARRGTGEWVLFTASADEATFELPILLGQPSL